MPIIPLKCPSCGANVTVDSSKDAAICEFCGSPYVVKDAIVNNYISNVTNIQADTVNVFSQKDFEIKAGTLIKYNGESIDIVIPDNVIEIEKECFKGLKIRSVKIPNGVRSIGEKAFEKCSNIEKIELPDSVKSIGEWAFSQCSGLESITLPEGITNINSGTFYKCASLKSIHLPRSVVRIDAYAFLGCTQLSTIWLPENVKFAPTHHTDDGEFIPEIFKGCNSVTSIKKSENNEDFGYDFFYPLIRIDSDGARPHYNYERPWDSPLGKEALRSFYKLNGFCQYCGRKFRGIFKKVCNHCKKEKDY